MKQRKDIKCLIGCGLTLIFLAGVVPGGEKFAVDGFAVDSLSDSDDIDRDSSYFRAEVPYSLEDFEKYGQMMSSPERRGASAQNNQRNQPQAGVIASAQKNIAAGNWNAARRDVELALQDNPNNPYLIKKAALLFAMMGENQKADAFFRSYVKGNPGDAEYIAAWAAVAIRLKQWKKAEVLLERAFKLAPRNLSAHFQAVVYQIATDKDEQLMPYNWARLTLAEILTIANWLEADQKVYWDLLSEDGFRRLIDQLLGSKVEYQFRNIKIHALNAFNAKKQGKWKPTRDSLQQLNVMGLKSYWIKIHLARANYMLGDIDRALVLFDELQKENPNQAAVCQSAAYVYINVGQYEKGAAFARRAHELKPKNAQIEFMLICAMVGSGEMDEAWPLLRDWVRRNPEKFRGAVRGQAPYLIAIRNDPRFGELRDLADGIQKP